MHDNTVLKQSQNDRCVYGQMSNVMSDNEGIDAMKSGLRDVDKLLNDLSSFLSSKRSYHYSLDMKEVNSKILIIDKATLDSISTVLQKGFDIDCIHKVLKKIITHSNNDSTLKLIPLSIIYEQHAEMFSLNISSVDHIKDNLINHGIILSIHRSKGCGFQIPFVHNGYHMGKIDENNKNIVVYSTNELQKLKKSNMVKWRQIMSNLQYESLKQQIYQVVSSLDLQVDVLSTEKIAERIICYAVAWKHSTYINTFVLKALKKIFGEHNSGKFFFFINDDYDHHDKMRVLQCYINSGQWDNYHGIGVNIESELSIKVYWKAKAQAVDEIEEASNDINGLVCLATLRCSITQGFPLYSPIPGIETNISPQFFDDETILNDECYSNGDTTVLLNLNLAYLSVKLDESLSNKASEKIASCLDEVNVDHKDERKNLGNVIKAENSFDSDDHNFDTDVYVWGDNSSNCMGLHINDNQYGSNFFIGQPSKIEVNTFSCVERVKSIACSSCHTLLLTNLGSLWSCGDGSDGQLGHNSLESISSFQPIECFDNDKDLIIFTQISVGSNETSSHSAAIDSNHTLYTWGKAIICGHVGSSNSNISYITVPRVVKALENYNVLQVSCGGGYSLVRTTDRIYMNDNDECKATKVFSWGLTANGRLGHGKVRKNLTESKKNKVPWCQCAPMAVCALSKEDIVDVSAGMKHSLAVNLKGEVYAWGSNSAGECSVVDFNQDELKMFEINRHNDQLRGLDQEKAPSIWDDVWVPRKISYFGNLGTNNKVVSVIAGDIHSAALDKDGHVYSWGGGGHNHCLGHGDMSTYEYGVKQNLDLSKHQFCAMSGHIEPPNWAVPRLMTALMHCKITSVSLGAKHGVALTDSNTIYVWGDLVTDETQGLIEINKTPSKPNCNYLHALKGKRITSICCASYKVMCISCGDIVAEAVGIKLFQESELLSIVDKSDKAEVKHSQNLKVDCMLIVGGKAIYCHKIIIAMRSPVLKNMILEVERAEAAFPEILVPGLSHGVMKQVLRYIYTDMIHFEILSSFSSLVSLMDAAKILEIQGLIFKCEQVLSKLHEYNVATPTKEMNETNISCKQSSLSKDLGKLLLEQDSKFADILIIAKDCISSNSIIFAHQCILTYSSEYFKNLLQNDHVEIDKPGTRTIILQGTYNDIMRLLYFLYTGVMATTHNMTANDTCGIDKYGNLSHLHIDIKTDIKNAVKLGLPLLKAQCESSIVVTPVNVFEVLLFAVEVESIRLKVMAMNEICQTMKTSNYSDMTFWKKELLLTLSKCPRYIKLELFEKIKHLNGFESITPKNRKNIAIISVERSKMIKEKSYISITEDAVNLGKDVISLSKSILVALVLFGLILQNIIPIGQSVIFSVNIMVLIATMLYLLNIIR